MSFTISLWWLLIPAIFIYYRITLRFYGMFHALYESGQWPRKKFLCVEVIYKDRWGDYKDESAEWSILWPVYLLFCLFVCVIDSFKGSFKKAAEDAKRYNSELKRKENEDG